ncbi:MAG: hypothetical protein V4534_02960 [Myxococcota bacterium]
MNRIQGITLQEKIKSLDFSIIIDKMVAHQGWMRADAEQTAALYRNFLFLQARYPNKRLPPSEDVDEFWHNHILDTEHYIASCDLIFGKYLHHYPYFGIDGKTNFNDLSDAFTETQQLHLEEFGTPIYQVRSWFDRLVSAVYLLFKIGTNRLK